MPKPETELLVINKMYDLVIWSCQRIGKFPRDRRYTLGDRLEGRLYSVLEELIQARYTTDRAAILRHVNLQLEMLRFQFRMAKDLRCVNPDSYAYAARSVNEVGKLVGAWLKKSAK